MGERKEQLALRNGRCADSFFGSGPAAAHARKIATWSHATNYPTRGEGKRSRAPRKGLECSKNIKSIDTRGFAEQPPLKNEPETTPNNGLGITLKSSLAFWWLR